MNKVRANTTAMDLLEVKREQKILERNAERQRKREAAVQLRTAQRAAAKVEIENKQAAAFE